MSIKNAKYIKLLVDKDVYKSITSIQFFPM